MKMRLCGKSDIEISPMGIGCWSYGGGDYWGPQAQSDVTAVVHAALDAGINFFDTAEGYNDGRSEEALGIALKDRRHEAIIGTKVSIPDPDSIREHCEASLHRLQTDYVDIYMIHWPHDEIAIEESMAELTRLREDGLVRAIGVSNFGVSQLTAVIETGTELAVNQLCYNLLSRAIEVELLPLCQEHNVGILGYMPLLQGLLTGKYKNAEEMLPVHSRFRHFRDDRPMATHGEEGAEEEVFETLKGIRKIAEDEQIPMSRLAIAWTMAKPGITCMLVGTRNVDELIENLRVIEWAPSADVIDRLDKLTTPLLEKMGANPDYFTGGRIR
ncbi:MAG: aldo/keto reductase [Candidatus Poribacteria bacterium]|nr:aldo/keto reductase [Candidatus Poribacteria bacterium]